MVNHILDIITLSDEEGEENQLEVWYGRSRKLQQEAVRRVQGYIASRQPVEGEGTSLALGHQTAPA